MAYAGNTELARLGWVDGEGRRRAELRRDSSPRGTSCVMPRSVAVS